MIWQKLCLIAALAVNSAAHAQDLAVFAAKAKENLTWDFKDPEAARFRGLFVSRMGDALILCGEVNAKNSYGAYIGFRRFRASDDRNFQDIWPADLTGTLRTVYEQSWQTYCGSRIADVP